MRTRHHTEIIRCLCGTPNCLPSVQKLQPLRPLAGLGMSAVFEAEKRCYCAALTVDDLVQDVQTERRTLDEHKYKWNCPAVSFY